ncbi:unnamed protein product (macronuclear) [Paramecium tetraurelia]|uniref:Uncharacterized protein n=1 Tax=Paramecium tetraurelia TaxID=5888 RepID=A0CIE3_PARTE|nr:uncharacterized protein GSPATT00007695001 [Paramecium tetraurelia]CAK70560.1 unnamed protein product [Paramecium tetraurelia]|eukprot:XP_001437957.1 hypothetical protein (macronuclear) [Paramecium tetraurelia strain d4-2]
MNQKKLPKVYRNDLENSFIRKFERSFLSQSQKSNQVTRVRLYKQKQPRYQINENLKQLSEWNEQKQYHKKLKYYPRAKSSESSIEGQNGKKVSQFFLLLPYHCPVQQRFNQCRMMWKRLIIGVEIIIFYGKLYREQLISKTASCPHIPPRRSSLKSLNYPASPPKRKFRSRTQGEGKNQPSGFGDFVKAMYESEKQKKELSSKSVITKEFRFNDSRIKRLVTSKICDQTVDLSRNRCASIKDSNQLPILMQIAPYKEENIRIKRVSSTMIRRIRTLRLY